MPDPLPGRLLRRAAARPGKYGEPDGGKRPGGAARIRGRTAVVG
ncbi:hypothetical protein [Arthrobacter silvisoli]|nr:hypothetical protein [Arthrobacter silvisoli]